MLIVPYSLLIVLLRDLCRHLLQALQQHDPQRYETSLAQFEQAALFGAKGEKLTAALTRLERALRLQQVVNQALRLHAHLDQSLRQAPFLPGEAEAELRLWLAVIAKVITDETSLEPDPDRPGYFIVTERPHDKKGQYRHACANDLDASYRDHGRGQPPQTGMSIALVPNSARAVASGPPLNNWRSTPRCPTAACPTANLTPIAMSLSATTGL